MPATEQTWRDTKLMHVIFGVSAVAMLLTTIWMLVVDHDRPWKEPQRRFRIADERFTGMQAEQQQTRAFMDQVEKLEDALERAKASPVPGDLVARFKEVASVQLERWEVSDRERSIARIDEAHEALNESAKGGDANIGQSADARAELLAAMQDVVKRVKYVEDSTARDKRNLGSQRDAARSNYEIAIRDALGVQVAQERLANYEEMEKQVGELDKKGQELKSARTQLDDFVKQANQPVDDAEKALKEQLKEFDRLHKAQSERAPNAGKTFIEFPILDAFNSPLRPHQIWLPNLKIKFPLNEVARFDRCMTCHQGMDKSLPGSPTEPAFPHEHRIDATLTPAAAPANEAGNRPGATFEAAYGMKLAEAGLIDEEAVTVVVFPGSIAARAGMRTADVIVAVDGAQLLDREMARRLLIDAVDWDNPRPMSLEVRRGLAHPFSAHPRLDLIGSDASPHPFGKIGCTICHEGQGTATAFQYAEHAPNTVAQENRWRRDYKWYENHYWDWPQRPKRFVESSCLKCHHDVAELKASERFPETPAPKLTRGYDLVREYGCFGCHEVRGYAGPMERIGPDLRAEPEYYAWATMLKQQIAPRLAELRPKVDEISAREFKLAAERDAVDARKKAAMAGGMADETARLDAEFMRLDAEVKKLTAERLAADAPVDELTRIHSLAESVRTMPEDENARAELIAQLAADADRAQRKKLLEERKATLTASLATATKEAKPAIEEQIKSLDARIAAIEPMVLSAAAHAMTDRFKDIESPGTLRKVGPSLRFVGAKVDEAFLHDWIENPKNFRPTTKMPRVFGQHAHLDETGRETAERFEAVEIAGIVAYLLDRSQSFSYIAPGSANDGGANGDGAGDAERGRNLFVTRGCIACHSIRDEGRPVAAEGEADDVAKALAVAREDQGPDLSRIGAKLAVGAKESGRDPQKWLYTWLREPNRYHARTKMPNMKLEPLPQVDATGKPVMEMRDGQEVAKATDPAADIAAYLLSLGGWTPQPAPPVVAADVDDLARQHLVKSFRDSEVDGILKSGLRRKPEQLKGDEAELAVGDAAASPEEMARRKLLFVGRRAISKYGCFGCHDVPGYEDAKPIGTGLADWGRKETDKLAFEQIAKYVGDGHANGHGDPHGASGHDARAHLATDEEKRAADDHEYFHHQLLHGSRAGFAWQKLREPRSYDFQKTTTKDPSKFNEWLRMPRFTFPQGEDDIEAVMTFLLGLVADPPTAQYVYNPPPRRKTIVEGLAVLEKFNCAGCHVLAPETITVAYDASRPGQPSAFRPAESFVGYDFLKPHLSSEEIAASLAENYQGRATATLRGLPSLQRSEPREYLLGEDQQTEYEPDPADKDPKTYVPFLLWEPAVIDGQMYSVGQKPTNVPAWLIEKRVPAWGGTAARLMMPLAFKQTQPVRQDLTGDGTWAIVPPPLLKQGTKTQGEWLHNFLLDPHPIRPAVVLRMPTFNMSSGEAQKLVAYFAAVDKLDRPYEFEPRTRDEHLVSADAEQPGRLANALKLTANVCSRCHLIGDFEPAGHDAGKAPNLERIHARMRPEYLRPWLANPPGTLPYTNMPVNFPHDTLGNQALYSGTSREQLEAVVDFLLNYDRYMKDEAKVSKVVEQYAPPPMAEAGAAAAEAPKAE